MVRSSFQTLIFGLMLIDFYFNILDLRLIYFRFTLILPIFCANWRFHKSEVIFKLKYKI